jgi:hypothetical protein
MPDSFRHRLRGPLVLVALLAAGFSLCGCAGMSDTVSPAFADPGKYELWDCKPLEAERKSLAGRTEELQRLMNKAETGFGGAVVSEMAYRNEYIAVRGQAHFADEAWRRGKCQESPPAAATVPASSTPAGASKRTPASKSGSAVH